MPKFYNKRFEKEIAKALKSGRIKQEAHALAERRVIKARKEMIEDFNSHAITRELEGGVTAENFSGTLGGYGNLFTFIGFPAGSQPTRPIRDYLKKSARVHREPRTRKSNKDLIMKFKVDSPTFPEIKMLSPSPWEGKSWAQGIEAGISGFGYYMYSQHENFENSRSKKGVQMSKKLREMPYRPVKYITSILNSFYEKIK